jgi:excisionase family DNA binding protein
MGEQRVYTVAEAAEYLRLSEVQVRRIIKRGDLRVKRVHYGKPVDSMGRERRGRILVGQDALDEFMAQDQYAQERLKVRTGRDRQYGLRGMDR